MEDIITYGNDYLISKYFKPNDINLIKLISDNEENIIKHI
jgi:hypothetical protein